MGSAGGDLQGVQRKAHMTTDPTRDRVKAILTLADAATPGEWQSASWNAHTILPKLWAEDELPPNERGPFTAIYTTKDEDAAYIVAVCNAFPDVAARLLEALDENERLHDETVEILQPLVTYLCDHHSERYGGRHCVDVALELLREYEGER